MPQSERESASALADLAELIRGRRSTNLFESRPVARQLILDAIEVARWAPNHRLTEPWRFYVIGPQTADELMLLAAEIEAEQKGEKARAARLARLRGVPGFIVLTVTRSGDALRQTEDYAACCCAAQNMMLYLWQAGVGVKWTTGDIVRDARFYRALGADPLAEQVVGFFWYGYPRIVAPPRRKDVQEIVAELP
jgi:nitroreductase